MEFDKYGFSLLPPDGAEDLVAKAQSLQRKSDEITNKVKVSTSMHGDTFYPEFYVGFLAFFLFFIRIFPNARIIAYFSMFSASLCVK